MLTLAEAKKIVSSLGYTLRHEDGEYIVFPKGKNADHPAAYFSSDLLDAIGTAEAMHARNGLPIGFRKVETTEELATRRAAYSAAETARAEEAIRDARRAYATLFASSRF